MANNRLYLYCPPCNQHVYLAKCLAEGYYNTKGAEAIGEAIVRFSEDHAWCDEGAGEGRQLQLRFEIHHRDRELPFDSSEPLAK